MPRKIKILNIIPEDNENEATNDEIKEVNEPEPIIESNENIEKQTEKTPKPVEENIKETPEAVEENIKETPTEIAQEEQKNVRIQELVKCPDCGKNMTKKTLRYFHPKVCPKKQTNKTEVKGKKEKIKVQDIEEIPVEVPLVRQTNSVPDEPLTPKIPKKIDYTPPVEVTYEDMRKQRLKARMEQRTIKIQNLFANAI